MEESINVLSLKLSLLEKTEDFRANLRRVKATASSIKCDEVKDLAHHMLLAMEDYISEMNNPGLGEITWQRKNQA